MMEEVESYKASNLAILSTWYRVALLPTSISNVGVTMPPAQASPEQDAQYGDWQAVSLSCFNVANRE